MTKCDKTLLSKFISTLTSGAFVACLLVGPALAQDILFDGGPAGTGMDYLTGENWDGDVVPTDGSPTVNGGGTPIIGDPGNLNPAVVNLGADAPGVWEIKVGRGGNGTGTLNHSAGNLSTENWAVVGDGGGAATPSNGIYNLSGTASLNVGVGLDGSAELNGSLGVGAGGGMGTVNVMSANASVTSDGYTIGEGDDSIGIFNQSAGTVNANTWMNVGQNGASNGTYNMSGGTLNTPELSISENSGSTGTFNASDSSVMNLGNVRVGRNDGSNGTLEVTGSSVSFIADQLSVASDDGGSSLNSSGTLSFLSDAGGVSTLNVNGNVTLNDGLGAGSTANLSVDLSGGDPGGDLVLVDLSGTLTGQFTGLAEGDVVPGANGRTITYNHLGAGNIALVIPEPSGILLLLGCIGGLLLRRK